MRAGGDGWKPRANTGLQACVWRAMTRGGYAVSLATPSQRASHILFLLECAWWAFSTVIAAWGEGDMPAPLPLPPKPRVRNIGRGLGHAPIRRARLRPPALKQIKY